MRTQPPSTTQRKYPNPHSQARWRACRVRVDYQTVEARLVAPLRLLWGGACAAVSVVSLFCAQTSTLYNLALRVTEYGHLLAAVSPLPLLVPGWRRTRMGQVGAALGAFAALLSLSSIIRAIPVASDLPQRLSRAFGDAPSRTLPGAAARPSPFVLSDILNGVQVPAAVQSTVSFVRRGDHELLMELYKSPEMQAPSPAVLVVHGGAWSGGSRTDNVFLSKY